MVEVKKHDFRNILGEELQASLAEATTLFKEGRLNESLIFIDFYISQVPENTPAAKDLKERLDLIMLWYKDAQRNLEIEEATIGLLERFDFQNKKGYTDVSFVGKKLKTCKNIFLKHKLYENSSQVDYEI